MVELANLGPTLEYLNTLKPYKKDIFNGMGVPSDIIKFLTTTGLPLKKDFLFTANNSIRFSMSPKIINIPESPDKFLAIGEIEYMGYISINLKSKQIWQVFTDDSCRSFINTGIKEFVNCLGTWASFYPQYRDYIEKMLEVDRWFNLFENPEIYEPIKKEIAKIDPQALKDENNFWTSWCSPDIV